MTEVQDQVWLLPQVYFGPSYCGLTNWTQIYKQVWMPVQFQIRNEIWSQISGRWWDEKLSKS